MGSSGTDWNGAAHRKLMRGAIPNPLCGEPGCTETMLHAHFAPVVRIKDRRQPIGCDLFLDDWLFVKPIALRAGEACEQHVHERDHATLVASGTIRVWMDGQDQGDVTGPKIIKVRGGTKHQFLAVTDTLFCCIWNLRGEGYPAIMEDV